MNDYQKIIAENYKENLGLSCPPDSRLEYIGSTIFNFTTYDGKIDARFAEEMLEVIEVILNKTNFEYIKNEENYVKYLTMINMPFMQDKLDWGTSIRGAWIEDYGDGEIEIDCGGITVPREELSEFLRQLIKFSKSNA